MEEVQRNQIVLNVNSENTPLPKNKFKMVVVKFDKGKHQGRMEYW